MIDRPTPSRVNSFHHDHLFILHPLSKLHAFGVYYGSANVSLQ